jgi:hypothetical protein
MSHLPARATQLDYKQVRLFVSATFSTHISPYGKRLIDRNFCLYILRLIKRSRLVRYVFLS